jgi:poly(hydroxyalkanoate) granule-associated protein
MSTKNTEIFRLGDLPKNVYQRVAELPRNVAGAGREAWLTGLGAIATIEHEGAKVVSAVTEGQTDLAKKGLQLEKRGKVRVEQVRARLGATQKRAAERVETMVVEPIAGTLQRFGLPSRAEVHELSAKVDLLTRKLNTLIKALDKHETAAPQH